MTDRLAPDVYGPLREEILAIIEAGKERARQAVEQEKVQTYRAIGQALHTHLLRHNDRAAYGEQIIARLSEDLGMSARTVYQILAFFRAFPIVNPGSQLSWTHYRVLSAIPKAAVRRQYRLAAEEVGWSVRELRSAIQENRIEQTTPAADDSPPERLSPRRGALYTYRIVRMPPEETPLLDLGFEIRYAVPLTGLDTIRSGLTVTSTRTDGVYRFRASAGGASRLYTFRAQVADVIDGDTLRVHVDCGFGVWVRQKLRLRGIDTPELRTAAGQRAREAVTGMLADASSIVLSTSRTDKYDRYVMEKRAKRQLQVIRLSSYQVKGDS